MDFWLAVEELQEIPASSDIDQDNKKVEERVKHIYSTYLDPDATMEVCLNAIIDRKKCLELVRNGE